MAECPTPTLKHKGVGRDGMTTNLTAESNITQLSHLRTFDGPISSDALLIHPDTPRLGDANPFNPSQYAVGITPRMLDNSAIWSVDVEYNSQGSPTIEEGVAYDFATRPLEQEVAVKSVYARYIYRTKDRVIKPVAVNPELGTEDFENGLIPATNTAGDAFSEPLMGVKTSILVTFWMLATKKLEEKVDDGTIYSYQGSTNQEELSLCGIDAKKFGIRLQSIIPTDYTYYAPGSTQPEQRKKLTIEIKLDPEANGYGLGVLSQGRNARLLPDGATSGPLEKRAIRVHDLPDSTLQDGQKGDEQVDYDVLLDGDGTVLDFQESDAVYLGFVLDKPFKNDEFPLPTKIGNYAAS